MLRYTLNQGSCQYFVVFIQYSSEMQEDVRGTENWRLCPSPDSPRKSVKSTAVVKYSSVQSYANFALLQCNTDLNLPPSNWLSSSAESYGLQYVPSHSSGFSRCVHRLRMYCSVSLFCWHACSFQNCTRGELFRHNQLYQITALKLISKISEGEAAFNLE